MCIHISRTVTVDTSLVVTLLCALLKLHYTVIKDTYSRAIYTYIHAAKND